jgi:hypothetical protein
MRLCKRLSITVSAWVELPDWEKQRFIYDEYERIEFINELLQKARDDDGKIPIDAYLSIMQILYD